MDGRPTDRARQVFEACLALPDERRETHIATTCAGDEGLAARVRRLLVAHARAAEAASHIAVPSVLEAPDHIGPYKILDHIAEGGMGVVYLAEQTEPVKRRVALKIIKVGMDTKHVIARFESERQALAMMNHPNVARIITAGATEQGRPYFVMDYVKGVSITDYCDQHRLTVTQRLRLFTLVCDGVQHAHQKGIIHRDLKPSNILVSIEGDQAVPKIIDFGVAKATDQRLTEQTLYTHHGMLIGTPEYMSPEQADLSGLDIDTRSDVYSLGMLLYELLAGALPFDPAEIRKATLEDAAKRFETPIPRPSARVASLGDAANDGAARRRADRGSLSRQLRGDLDWIVLKALDADRTKRYGSVSDLAQDVQRHLRLEPVVAGPPSASYRLQRFVQRHRLQIASLGAVAAILLLGVIGTAIGMWQARREADRAQREAAVAEAVNEFLNHDLLAAAAPEELGIDVTMREVLGIASQRVSERFEDQPRVEAAVRQTIGTTYRRLGEYESALPHLIAALHLMREPDGDSEQRRAQTTVELAEVYRLLDRPSSSESLLVVSLPGLERSLGRDDLVVARLKERLAGIYMRDRRYGSAESLLVVAGDARLRTEGESSPGMSLNRHTLANLMLLSGRREEAVELYSGVLDYRRVAEPDHPRTLSTMHNLGMALTVLGRLDEAEPLMQETVRKRVELLGATHPQTLKSRMQLAHVHRGQGRYDAAIDGYQATLEGQAAILPEDHTDWLATRSGLGSCYLESGRPAQAATVFEDLVERASATLGPKSARALNYKHHLGVALRDDGRLRDARRWLESAARDRRELYGATPLTRLTSQTMTELALVYHDLGLREEAEALLTQVADAYDARTTTPDDPAFAKTINALVELYEGWGQDDEAAKWRARKY